MENKLLRDFLRNVTAAGAEFSRRYGFEQVQLSEHDSCIFEQDYAAFAARVLGTPQQEEDTAASENE